MHPVIEIGSRPKTSVTPLTNWQIAEVKASGGSAEDLRALCYAKAGKERDMLHRFILHHLRHGATVVSAFEKLADEAVAKGFPLRLGSETLAATARFMCQNFPLSNNERPGYVIALRIKRPDLAEMLDAEAAWPDALLRSGWNPWREATGNE